MTIRYEFCDTHTEDGMWDHPTGRIRIDALDGKWVLDGQHPGPTDEEIMRPIIDAAMRYDNDKGPTDEHR